MIDSVGYIIVTIELPSPRAFASILIYIQVYIQACTRQRCTGEPWPAEFTCALSRRQRLVWCALEVHPLTKETCDIFLR
jgi:hypothetical protein